jgi:hypothetical protein
MFKLSDSPNMQKIVVAITLGLPIYIMSSLVYKSYSKREGLTGDDPAARMQELNDQILSDIQQLQELEKGLYAKMEALSAAKQLTQKDKDEIIANIDELSKLRVSLYETLKNNYDHYQTTSITTSNTYDQQTTAVAVVEKELSDAKARLESMQDDKNNKIRYIGVNTYYGKQYDEHSKIMKIIIFMCVPIIILSILSSKGIIPGTLVAIITGIVFAVGILFLGKTVLSILNRDKMNYDRIDWNFDPASAPDDSDNLNGDGDVDPWAIASKTCIGQACCDQGSTYDETQNMCLTDVISSTDSTATGGTATGSTGSMGGTGTGGTGTGSTGRMGGTGGTGSTGTKIEQMSVMNNGGKYAPQYSSYKKSESSREEDNAIDAKLNNYAVFSKR